MRPTVITAIVDGNAIPAASRVPRILPGRSHPERRPSVDPGLSRRGHVLLPLVLVTLGVLILVECGAFSL
jgi:hypothetical protein